jgi:small subunit ribosomal protein S20
MPNTKSAKKQLKQDIILRERNRSIKKALRTQCRKVLSAIEEGHLDQAQTEFRLSAKKLDQAAAKHVIHRNAAARTKSRLSARVKTLKQRTPATG